jgi:hypothetical protein
VPVPGELRASIPGPLLTDAEEEMLMTRPGSNVWESFSKRSARLVMMIGDKDSRQRGQIDLPKGH